MPASPFSSIFGFFKPYALEVFCALCLFLWSSQVVSCTIFVALLSAINFFILSISKCGCYGNNNGDKYMVLHRSDGHCKYYGKKPVPNTYGLAVFLNQNYNAYVVVLAVCISYCL